MTLNGSHVSTNDIAALSLIPSLWLPSFGAIKEVWYHCFDAKPPPSVVVIICVVDALQQILIWWRFVGVYVLTSDTTQWSELWFSNMELPHRWLKRMSLERESIGNPRHGTELYQYRKKPTFTILSIEYWNWNACDPLKFNPPSSYSFLSSWNSSHTNAPNKTMSFDSFLHQ